MRKIFKQNSPAKRGAVILLALSAAFLGVGKAEAQTNDPQALVEKGRGIAIAADCMACHTVPHSNRLFAGGYPIVSPLGTIYSTNITPSKTAGIGSYTEDDFDRAVRKGIRKDGGHLYPAMPYTAYAEISDADMHALYAYFMNGVEPVDDKAANQTNLPFPFNIRFSMAFWNLLYSTKAPFQSDPGKSEEINRGAYLAGALGHCSSCHSPRGLLMGESAGSYLAGGAVGPWYAPNITSDPVSGIGGWSTDELVQYFRDGHADGKNQAAGGMAEAVQNSLQYLPDADLHALASYLKSVPAIRDPGDTRAAHEYGAAVSSESSLRGVYSQTEHNSLRDGAQLYSGYCASCHQIDGAGSENQAYPSLFHNTATGASRPANLVATILYGVERETAGKQVLMPGFGAQSYVTPLTDQQIVDVSNYVLMNFGNPATKVTLADVAIARAGGPVPFLARVQPYILTVILSLVAIVLLVAAFWVLRKRRAVSVAA
ncbi:c-type cytochrome [Rhizobium rhizogenes]|uniref:c-type cytochrome n=1 Tax=Rhizobium rhizogenes TaxID=359 RepID=UPI0015719B83|nr:cytochrome c [Rhizobium rhizogenes]